MLVGFESSDDACVYKVSDEVAMINTIDFFPPIVDDPYMFGQIAAANSLSDVFAMGGTPKLAMNLLCVPNCLPLEAVKGILEGGNDKVNEAGAIIVGGHSIEDNEPKYGLSVTGFAHPKDILANTSEPGDLLVITKKIGTGILSTADKVNFLTKEESDEMARTMAELNKYAFQATKGIKCSGCTDITGFGLAGHAAEMAKTGNTTLELWANSVPIFPKALELASMGIIPAGAYKNRTYLEPSLADLTKKTKLNVMDCLYDPQTSGGLLFAVKEKDLARLQDQLGEQGCQNAVVGQFKTKGEHFVEIHD